MSTAVKICGLSDKESLRAAIEGGASYIGFVFVPSSKRHIAPQKARELLATLPHPALCRFTNAAPDVVEIGGLVLTALFVDPTDKQIEEAMILRPFLGLLQLHGNEKPERVADIKQMTKLPVMKAIHVSTKDDLKAVAEYEKVADMLLFDTKVGKSPTGGTGKSFDWKILKSYKTHKPWMLAGGLNIKNFKDAIKISGAKIIDLSSGVETKDKKDPEKIKTFLKAFHEQI